MKKIINVVAMCVSLTMLSGCMGGGGSALSSMGMGGGSSKSSGMSTGERAKDFAEYILVGTVNLLNAVSKMQEAVGNKEQAEQIAMQAKNLKEKADLGEDVDEEYEKSFQLIDESMIDREQFAAIPAKQGSKNVGKSLIHLMVGMLADKKALEKGQDLISNPPGVSDLMDGSIKSAFSVAKLAVNVLPDHISKAGTWTSDLTEYMKSNDLEPPSPQEVRDNQDEVGASDEMMNDMFPA
jgi:hypothetical protein